ncbi:hypothetical protein ATOBIA_N08160 [Atopobiaceae bacterium P1]|nr:hypothetical protein ATOBIA_N08160 [Atopobiaceae bacterium P1]
MRNILEFVVVGCGVHKKLGRSPIMHSPFAGLMNREISGGSLWEISRLVKDI